MIRFKVFFRRIIQRFNRILNRCPRHIRVLGAPLLGGIIGLIGGIPGFFIGLLLGYLLGELFVQSNRDNKLLDYLMNPGPQQFHEGEPGLAAWCALGVMIASAKTQPATSAERVSASEGSALPSEGIIKLVILEACHVFTGPGAEPYLMEHFSRLAWQRKDSLNPDLLAESLAWRRAPMGDAGNLGLSLLSLAEGEKAQSLARRILFVLDPAGAAAWADKYDQYGADSNSTGLTTGSMPAPDPWKILGLKPGTPLKEVKTLYRRLAKQFHPDELEVLDEKRRETAARAFIAIKDAYEKIANNRE